MAAPTVTLTVNGAPNGVDNTQRHQVLTGILAFSAGGTYETDGVPFTWTFLDAEGGVFIPDFDTATPTWVDIESQAGNIDNSYLYDPVHGTIRIAVDGTELDNAADIPVDTIGFRAEFNKGY